MTAEKLIKLLLEMPPEKQVVVWCHNDPHPIKSVTYENSTTWLDVDD